MACCEIQTFGESNNQPCATPEQFRQFLFSSLTLAEGCIPPDFQDKIDCLWDIYEFQAGCDLELQYLYTRLEAIKLMMNCAVFDIDRRDSRSESNSRSESASNQDGYSQAQQTSMSVGFSDLVGIQRYGDFADSTLRAETQRTAFSEAHDRSRNTMDDTGRGESYSDTDGVRDSESHRQSTDHSESESNTDNTGAQRGYNFQYSQSKTGGSTLNLAAAGGGRTGTKNAFDQIMRSDTANFGLTNRFGLSTKELRGEASSFSESARRSSSFFRALMDDNTVGTSQAHAEDHARGQSDSVSHAEGTGQSSSEGRAKTLNSSQGTSKAHSESQSQRDGTRNAFYIMDDVKASQRFENLLGLYDNTKKLLDLKRLYKSTTYGYSIGRILTCDPCGFVPIGAVEKLFCKGLRHYDNRCFEFTGGSLDRAGCSCQSKGQIARLPASQGAYL